MATNKDFRAVAISRNRTRCYYCGTELSPEEMTTDHAKPKSKGGSGHVENLRVACHECNGLKGDKDIDVFLEELSQGVYLK